MSSEDDKNVLRKALNSVLIQGRKTVAPNYEGYAVIGAGLPRTGTLSMQAALQRLLNGPCYHMIEVFERGQSEVYHWEKVYHIMKDYLDAGRQIACW